MLRGPRAATPADGPLSLQIEEWKVPTLGQRSRDPVEAPDGSIWWVGQWLDILGRLDPDAETFQSWPIPSGPVYAGILPHMRTTLDSAALLIHQSGTNHIARVTVEDNGAAAEEAE
ncbi:hypothetical protein [Halomonas sp. ML-15]|uniref:hypothetical protein n=1 Tax=Halomonas sp. ML-15 TaxID=2773305 RepID=UPI001CD0A2ED|nr:hypothetical protein [Halomonas sp. ML-15]